jgi:hypothetical protein
MHGQSKTILWPGGEHEFLLDIGALRAIEDRCKAGVSVVYERLLSNEWYVDDIIQPLRLGLIGGGMTERQAKAMIESAYDVANYYALAIPAAAVLGYFITWSTDADTDNPVGEAEGSGAMNGSTHSQTAEPAGPATSV